MEINDLIEMLENLENFCDGKVYIDGKEIRNIVVNLSNEINKEESINILTI